MQGHGVCVIEFSPPPEKRASFRAVKTTGSLNNRMESGSERPRAISDAKLKDVTITVLPGSGSREGEEGVNPFKPSKKLLRSPTTGGNKEVYDGRGGF